MLGLVYLELNPVSTGNNSSLSHAQPALDYSTTSKVNQALDSKGIGPLFSAKHDCQKRGA